MKSIKLGFLGAGSFGRAFLPLFKAHPGVHSVSLTEIIPERLREMADSFGITETYDSSEALFASDCDAVAIFTQRHLHAPLAIAAMRAGKHVYCAVPVGLTVEEIQELTETVRATGRIYMLGETSYYYPSTILCRELWRQGVFGRFVYGEGEYMHDMEHGFYQAYKYSGGEHWQRAAGIPPMLYPTHTVSMITGVTGAHLTRVSCLGQVDQTDDGVFREGANLWDNVFSNETALARTSDGGMARINEFRRIGHWGGRSVRLSIFGTLASFEEQPEADMLVTHDRQIIPVSDLLRCAPVEAEDIARLREKADGAQLDFHSGLAPVHPKWRLPQEFEGHKNGHHGSHQFLVDDFVRACLTGLLPPNHVWSAARYNLPGIVAHESAKREGEMLEVPDFGDPPSGSKFLETEVYNKMPLEWELPPPARQDAKWW